MIHNNIIGVDISDSAIKIVQLDGNKSVVTYGNFELSEGVVLDGVIIDTATFIEKCKDVLKHTKPVAVQGDFKKPHAIVSLPEDRVWSYTFVIPPDILPKEHESYLNKEASKVIPQNISELYTAHFVTMIRDTWFATFVGAKKEIIDTYINSFNEAGLEVDFIGSNFYSIARAVLPESFGTDNYLIVNIGERRVTIGVFDENDAAYMTTQTLVSKEDLEKISTEDTASNQQKLTYPEKPMKLIIEDIIHVKDNFLEHTGQNISKILVTGQLTDMTGFIAELRQSIPSDMELGNAYRHINNFKIFNDSVSPASFANTIGLALYGVDRTVPHINLLSNKVGYVRNSLSVLSLNTFSKKEVARILKNLLSHIEIPNKNKLKHIARDLLTRSKTFIIKQVGDSPRTNVPLVGTFIFVFVSLGFLFYTLSYYLT